jgi:hypothetical protein
MSKRLFLPAFLVFLGLEAPSLWAAEPSVGGGGSDPNPLDPPSFERDRNSGTTNFSDTGQPEGLFVQGRITDSSGKALEGIKVKLFSSGLLVSTVQSDAEGKFKISGSPEVSLDRPVDLWFASPDSRWVDSAVLLSTGAESANELRPACTPVIPLLGGSATVEMKMLTFEERRQEISRLRCLETAAKR